MALSLKDPATDALARQLAELTGETLTRAVREALKERLEQLKNRAGIDAILERFDTLPVLDSRSEDEILGYDENGIPS